MPTEGAKGEGSRLTLNLEGLKRDEERPAIAVTVLGNDVKPILVATAAPTEPSTSRPLRSRKRGRSSSGLPRTTRPRSLPTRSSASGRRTS